ncbi:hypothetical protein BH24CHL5_BH24CHL5_12710 [soil metagenome]
MRRLGRARDAEPASSRFGRIGCAGFVEGRLRETERYDHVALAQPADEIERAGQLGRKVITLTGAGTQTVPMWIFSAIQRPNELPVVNVVAFILIIVSVVPVYLAQRISGGVAAVGGRG